MHIWVNGIDYTTQQSLHQPFDEQTFGDHIYQSLSQNAAELGNLTKASPLGTTFRGEIERRPTVDLGDPLTAGWTFLINKQDPDYDALVQAIAPLATHRGMQTVDPLIYNNEPPDEWFDWLLENYSSLNVEKLPQYILIIGSPQQVSFRFQSFLSTVALVGRVHFKTTDELKTYVEKIIRLEKSDSPTTGREVVCFAPDAGPTDATYFSRNYMAGPIAKHIQDRFDLAALNLMGDDATKARFQEALQTKKPALVYTASHGLGAPAEKLQLQENLNGGICCQRSEPGEKIDKWLFAARDVPANEPIMEGAILFQFACFGYGTPAESDFMHWLGKPEFNSHKDFVAALPTQLLAHSRGPTAFIGHVDTAWLHGFADPKDPHILERWHPRLEPFVRAVDKLLQVQPVGLALAEMTKRYNVGNLLLSSTFERLQRNKLTVTAEFKTQLANTFITRNDAQNYMVFGDPAVRLRIPSE